MVIGLSMTVSAQKEPKKPPKGDPPVVTPEKKPPRGENPRPTPTPKKPQVSWFFASKTPDNELA